MRLLPALLLLICASAAPAQVASSSLLGGITDPSNAAVPEVKVTVRHEATGFTRTALTGTSGQYRFDDLIPGAYTVTAEKPGFKSELTSAVTLEVNQKGCVDLQLELGAASDSVTVQANASPVATDDASISRIVE